MTKDRLCCCEKIRNRRLKFDVTTKRVFINPVYNKGFIVEFPMIIPGSEERKSSGGKNRKIPERYTKLRTKNKGIRKIGKWTKKGFYNPHEGPKGATLSLVICMTEYYNSNCWEYSRKRKLKSKVVDKILMKTSSAPTLTWHCHDLNSL